ncbi:MAG: S41 family peptidase [Gemmobacter sp.]
MFAEDARRIRALIQKDTAFSGVASSDLDAADQRLARAETPDDFRLEAMRTLALAGNGHSRAIANAAVNTWALRLVWLADGPCVVEGPHAGARVVAVNGMSVAQIFGNLRPYLAGTTQRARALAGFMLAWAPALSMATGVKGDAVYSLTDIAGSTFDLTASDSVQAQSLYPLRDRGVADLLIARAGIASLDEARRGIFRRQLPGRVAYVRIADLGAGPPDTLAAKLAAISSQIRGIRRLVIDLRGNPGGDFFGAAAFARGLPVVAPGAALAVLVDKFTFSAALVTAALLKFHARGRLVGEEMGDAAAFHAEGGTEVLPRSGLSIRYSDGWHDWDTGNAHPVLTPPEIAREMVAAGSLIPEIAAQPTGADFLAGRDVALDAALALVRG